jgi:diguanylate cyclase (GGDEF)-like protein
MVIQFVKAGNTNVVAGLFTNLFTLVAVTVIYFMNKKNMRFQQRITSQAITDRLTDLPNRFAVSELIEKLIRDQERFTFLSIDINNFKTINDTMGHEFGDKVLIEIANRWRDLAESDKTETKDFVARLGGDEYALIIRGYNDVGQIKRSVHKYKDELERVITIEECDYFMTANFGFAEYPTDAMTSNAIISGANAAMHAAGKKGENNILRYDPDALKDVRSMEVERIIRRALENNTITFNLQPQYDISHRLRGFEALARLKDEDGTMISPGEFIPVAEKTGLVDQIDSRVFELAVEFVSRVMNETLSNITMSVNVSVRHLMKNNFIEEVRNMLEKYGVPAHFIEIEITESIMIDSTDKARNTISELKAMGIKIAIDDFGTGYSSLSYLNNLPSDILKIDKSFIDVMNNTESNKQYVSMIVSIGHILNLKVISEGVESDDQVDTLKEIGCDYIQGFVWGRPMPAENAMLLVLKDS